MTVGERKFAGLLTCRDFGRKNRRLLDIALKHTLPKLSIEKHIADDRLIKEDIYIHIIGRDGKEISKEKTNV